VQTIRIPALIVIGFWAIIQLLSGLTAQGIQSQGGIAWFAHVGGFVAGLVTIKLWQPRRVKNVVVVCPKCKTKLKVDDAKLSPQGSRFKCPKCSTVLAVKKPVVQEKKGPRRKEAPYRPFEPLRC